MRRSQTERIVFCVQLAEISRCLGSNDHRDRRHHVAPMPFHKRLNRACFFVHVLQICLFASRTRDFLLRLL